jgi:hypothetical protein
MATKKEIRAAQEKVDAIKALAGKPINPDQANALKVTIAELQDKGLLSETDMNVAQLRSLVLQGEKAYDQEITAKKEAGYSAEIKVFDPANFWAGGALGGWNDTKTVTLGPFKTQDELDQALERAKFDNAQAKNDFSKTDEYLTRRGLKPKPEQVPAPVIETPLEVPNDIPLVSDEAAQAADAEYNRVKEEIYGENPAAPTSNEPDPNADKNQAIDNAVQSVITEKQLAAQDRRVGTVREEVHKIIFNVHTAGRLSPKDKNLPEFVQKDIKRLKRSDALTKIPIMASTLETYEVLQIALPFSKNIVFDENGNAKEIKNSAPDDRGFVESVWRNMFNIVDPESDDSDVPTNTLKLNYDQYTKRKMFKSSKFRRRDGTSGMSNVMGMSPVLNPPYQFNKNDDVRSDTYFPEYGRLFNTHVVSNYPTVMFEVGRIDYNQGFIRNLIDRNITGDDGTKQMIDKIRKAEDGDLSSVFEELGPVAEIIKFGARILTSPFILIKGAKEVIRWATGLNKSAVFVSQSNLFNNYCDYMLLDIATKMGLIGKPGGNYNAEKYKSVLANGEKYVAKVNAQDSGSSNDNWPFTDDTANQINAGTKDTSKDWFDSEETSAMVQNSLDAISQAIEGAGNMVAGAASKVKSFVSGDKPTVDPEDTDDYFGDLQFLRMRFIQPFNDIIGGGSVYPYVIHKDIVVTESYDNTTRENPIAEAMNEDFGQKQDQEAKGAKTGVVQLGTAVKQALSGDFSGISSGLESGLAYGANKFFSSASNSVVISGDGRVALPAMWESSSMSRSIDLDFEFFSPYAHELAEFESCIVPLVPLINMTLPRQISDRSFMNPFFVRVFSKGLFNIPLGIVRNLTIDRSTNESNVMTDAMISRLYRVTMSIEDLNPTVMTGLSTGLMAVLTMNNDNYTNMLNTMSGLSFFNTRNIGARIQRFMTQVKHRWKFVSSFDSPNFDRNNPLLAFRDYVIPKNVLRVVDDATLNTDFNYF